MKRFLPVLLLICMICLGGCSEKTEILGRDKVEALRSEAAEYQSAIYVIKNMDNYIIEQAFHFCFDEEGRQSYLLESGRDGELYLEYSNGTELFRKKNGVLENIASTDEAYAAYTREDPHPYSTGQLFFYIKDCVGTSEQTVDEDGNTVYIHRYDVEKLNMALESPVSEFTTYYAFDSEGKFVYFCQHNVSAEAYYDDGTPVSYTYEITLREVNGIAEIPNLLLSKVY